MRQIKRGVAINCPSMRMGPTVWTGLLLFLLCREVLGLVEVTRHHNGDYFSYRGSSEENCQLSCHEKGAVSTTNTNGSPCRCQCEETTPTFREDVMECLADIQECDLADFSRQNQGTKIPFIFMPHMGQLVHPSAQIALQGVTSDGKPITSPVCTVADAQYLTRNGWGRLANTTENDFPFRLYRDAGKTYLQWLGSSTQRRELEGRLVLVYLLCKENSEVNGTLTGFHFSPCVGFRVAGVTGESALLDSNKGLEYDEYLIIGLTVGALIIAYVIAVVFYIFTKRRKKRRNLDDEEGSLESGHKSDNKRLKEGQRKLLAKNKMKRAPEARVNQGKPKPGKVSDYQRRKLETVAGVQSFDIDVDERVTGDDEARKNSLVFNPNYFEIELLKAPPPAAEEFLERIREMIENARDKLKANRFEPSLFGIPESDDCLFPTNNVYVNEAFTEEEGECDGNSETGTVNDTATGLTYSPSPRPADLPAVEGKSDPNSIHDRLESVSSKTSPDDFSVVPKIANSRNGSDQRKKSTKSGQNSNILDTGVFLNPSFFNSPKLSGKDSGKDSGISSKSPCVDNSDPQLYTCSAKYSSPNIEIPSLDPTYEKGKGFQAPAQDDFLNDLLSSAEAKVPKIHSSDSETQSDSPSCSTNDSFVDSLRVHRLRKHQRDSGRQDTSGGATSPEPIYNNTQSDASGVSRVIIKEDNDNIRSKLTIEVKDNLSDYSDEDESYDADTLERAERRKVERKDSIIQDSLERPSKIKGKRKGRTYSYPGSQGVQLVGTNIKYSSSNDCENNSSVYVLEPAPRHTDTYESDSLTLQNESFSSAHSSDVMSSDAGGLKTFRNYESFRSLGRSNSGIEIRTVIKASPSRGRSNSMFEDQSVLSGDLVSRYLARNQSISSGHSEHQDPIPSSQILKFMESLPELEVKRDSSLCDATESGVDSGKDSDSIPPSPEVLTWNSRIDPKESIAESEYTCKRSDSMDSGHSEESPTTSSEEDVDTSIDQRRPEARKSNRLKGLPTYKFGESVEKFNAPKFSRSLSYSEDKSGDKDVLSRLRSLEQSSRSADVSQGMVIALNLRSRLEQKYGKDFEKHLGDKNPAESIKRKWRKITRSESDLDIIMREGRLIRYRSNDSIGSNSSLGRLGLRHDDSSSLRDSSEFRKKSKVNSGIKLLVKMFEDPRRQHKYLHSEYTRGGAYPQATISSCDNTGDISRSAEDLLCFRQGMEFGAPEGEMMLDSLEPMVLTNR